MSYEIYTTMTRQAQRYTTTKGDEYQVTAAMNGDQKSCEKFLEHIKKFDKKGRK